MLIYCAHKYGGNNENKLRAEILVSGLQKADSKNVYISPIHAFGFMYDSVPYDEGMRLCLSLLDKCDALLVLSDESEGVKREIEFAIQHKKHIWFGKEVM